MSPLKLVCVIVGVLAAASLAVHADDEITYDPYWALIFPTPPADFDINNSADRDSYLYGAPTWTDLSKDPAFMDGVPHTSHAVEPVFDLNNGCQGSRGFKNPDGSITYCSPSTTTCSFCSGCDIRPPTCPSCAGRDLHFIAGTAVSPFEAPTPNFITSRFPIGDACPQDLLSGVPALSQAQGIQDHFRPITLALRAVVPFAAAAGGAIDRTYTVNDGCVSSYAIDRIDQILVNGNDAPYANKTSADGSFRCEIFNSAGFLGAIGLENVATPLGFPATCYSKALVPFSFQAKGLVDPFSHGGSFTVNKACVRGLREAYIAAAAACAF